MPKKIADFNVKRNIRLANDFFVLELVNNNSLDEIKPGQFVQVRVEGSPETFLRRPISIHDIDYERNMLKLLIQIIGKGTETLSRLKAGEAVNIIYPLGNFFSIPQNIEKVLLIGGGCGIAPLLFLGRYLVRSGTIPDILLGFRNSTRIIEYEEYKEIGTVYLTTEDGSQGIKGFVTNHPLLKEKKFDRIYCCGPETMMRAVAAYCDKEGIYCEASLENLMACGFGACLCCVVSTVRGNLCTCIEGPVFNTKELKW